MSVSGKACPREDVFEVKGEECGEASRSWARVGHGCLRLTLW